MTNSSSNRMSVTTADNIAKDGDSHHDDQHHDRSEGDRGRQAESPSEIPARGWKDIAVRVKDETSNDHVMLAAAGVAFFAFLAVVPAMAALMSIAGLLMDPERVSERIDDLFSGLPSEARDLLTAQLETIAGRTGSSLSVSLAISLLLALWSASSGVSGLIEGVNVAYDEHDDRNFVVRKLLALAFTLGAIAFVIVAVAGMAALPAILRGIGVPSTISTILQFAFWPLLAIGFMTGLALLYRYGPDRDEPEWGWVSWGAVIAVVLWVAASLLFRLYAANFGSYDETYGSLAAVVMLLLWLLITAFVVLLGAQINAEMEHQTTVDTTEGPDRPMGDRDATMADTVGAASD